MLFKSTELADDTLPLACISALLDIQTISGCAHIFAYLESRVDLLIVVRASMTILDEAHSHITIE
jgi:hypothetical protein